MSDAMSRATCHLERLLKELQSDSTLCTVQTVRLGGCGACDDRCPLACDSAGVGGSSDPLDKGTLPSSRVSVVSNSESDDASTLSGCDGTSSFDYHGTKRTIWIPSEYYREETARLVQQLGDSRVLVATLEAREAENLLYIERLEEEVLRLEETVEQEVGNLARRQDQVELEVQPSLEEQFKTTKDVLHDFDVSEPLYIELKSIPDQQRNAREHILILAYEKFLHDREEIQELRISQDSSREALIRANDEVQRLTDELHRVAANHANYRRESELDLSATVARIEQLEAERRDSLAQIEVRGKLENLERKSIDAENQKAAVEAILQVATQERESLRGSIKEKDHILDLMSIDKTYLSKEIQSLKELKKVESELEQQHEKLREVKRERTELHNKVPSDKRDSQAEILQIKEQTNQDIRELQRTTDLKEAETQSNLKAANCELDQLKVILEETKNALDQSRRENEVWITNEKMLTEKFNEEKIELEKSLLGLKEELRVSWEQLEIFQREKEKVESFEREKAKSFSAWRIENTEGSEGKLKGSEHENQPLEQNSRCDNEEEERVSIRSQSVQGDIRKLLRARSSVEQLHSLLKEKGVSTSVSRLKSMSTSSRSSLKDKKPVYSPRISNLDPIASPTRKELQMMIERGERPPRCHQHRSCSSHYPKAYEELVDIMSRRAPAPFSQAPDSAPFSSAPAPPQTPFSQDRKSCS